MHLRCRYSNTIMANLCKPSYHLFPFLIIIILLLFVCLCLSTKFTYIVHVSNSHMPTTFSSPKHWYYSILQSLSSNYTSTDEAQQQDILYTYSHSATGFAVHISEALAAKLDRHPSVLSVSPDLVVGAATTQSPDFLGLSDGSGIWPKTDYGSDIVIGIIDTGVWPESLSFHDNGLGKVPASWRGTCEVGPNFSATSCNNKLIGARIFYKGYEAQYGPLGEVKSARDSNGHGTHCASIASGSSVNDVSYNNRYAFGQARGVATKARVAAYKALWGARGAGTFSDILAAMDQAIQDGVHVLSMSLGGTAIDYYTDEVTIGAFHAMQKGVVVSIAAGNNGPGVSTVTNIAPWMLTVGASTINRQFTTDVVLGNGQVFTGSSLFAYNPSNPDIPMLAIITGESANSRFCKQGELDTSKVYRTIVLCEADYETSATTKSYAVQQAGGSGVILVNQASKGDELIAYPYFIPATTVSNTIGTNIKRYISRTTNPTTRISFRGTVIGPSPSAPRVASFSSRGPNPITTQILKPDVIAPGVNILAAWNGDVVPYNIISGTSMACPHVSGLAALLRKAYPSWTPAAIKSAIMTTAYNLDNAGNNIIDLSTVREASAYVKGSGHIAPNKTLNPGLVYDLDTRDYISFLCSIGYTNSQIALFVQDSSMINCRVKPLASPGELNYPSFSVVFGSMNDVVSYRREVTNVGSSIDAVYQVIINAPAYVRVNVNPSRLVCNANTRKLSYTITFTSLGGFVIPNEGFSSFGSIEWSDGTHRVRSPIVTYWPYTSSVQEDFAASI